MITLVLGVTGTGATVPAGPRATSRRRAVFTCTVRRLPVLCVALVAALALSAPAASATPLKSIWGPLTLPNGQPAGPTYQALGVDDFQTVITWSTVAPTRPANPRDPNDPAYHWPASVDDAVAAGRQYGFTVTAMLSQSPPWANGGHPAVYAPTNPRDFADFAFAAAKRYPGVRRWMIWGEPTRRAQFRPLIPRNPSAARRYARLLDATYGALKQAARNDVVIGGMSFTAGDIRPREWIKWMRLPNGKPPRLDWYGHNPFSTRIPDLSQKPFANNNYDFSDLDSMEAQLRDTYRRAYPKFRRHGPRIWVSEFTIQADHGSQDFNFYVSARDQGRWIAAAFREAGRTNYVAGVGWLGLLDEPAAPFNRTTGLLTYDLQPKPAFFAYQRAK
jgi:hypothetical protein